MDRMESEIFNSNHPLLTHIILWRRYVDDVICIWNGTHKLIQQFLDFINSLYPSIEFTLEIGGEKLNFLDLTITIEDDKYNFEIYQKPTATDTTIHGSSFCPLSHKLAAYYYFIHGLVLIPLSDEAFNKELLIIKHIAGKNNDQH